MKNNPKPIYVVITPFFPQKNNFVGSFIFDQCVAIRKTNKYDLLILKPTASFTYRGNYSFEGFNVEQVLNFQFPSNVLPGFFNFLNKKILRLKIAQKTRDLDQIAVVHFHGIGSSYMTCEAKKINNRIKTVVQFHGLDVLGLKQGLLRNSKIQRYWILKNAKWNLQHADIILGVSKRVLDSLNKYGFSELKRQMVLYNGVNLDKFYYKTKKTDHHVFVIGCVGNFIKIKDQITLLKAAKYLVENGKDNIRLKLIGSGPCLKKCEQFVVDNNLETFVEFKLAMPHKDLIDFYNSIDLFVLPSIYEAFGCVYLEAFACGVPFLAVNGQGISELILEDERRDFLFSSGNFVELSELIMQRMEVKKFPELTISIDIDKLVGDYLDEIGNSKN